MIETKIFSQPPRAIIGDRMTLPIDRVIVQLFADLDNGAYCCWPTNRQIAAEVGCSIRTVHNSLKRLSQLGWITIEPCPTVARGQMIRLNWRRPAPSRKAPPARGGGRQPVAGGSATGCRGGRQPVADSSIRPSIQTHNPERARAGGEEEQTADVLSPEEVAWWEGVAAGGDRTQVKLARVVLRKHAEATAAREATAKALAAQANAPGS